MSFKFGSMKTEKLRCDRIRNERDEIMKQHGLPLHLYRSKLVLFLNTDHVAGIGRYCIVAANSTEGHVLEQWWVGLMSLGIIFHLETADAE